MNTTMKHAEELRVPDDLWKQIQRCHEAAHEMDEWIDTHPCPDESGSEMTCKNWYRTLLVPTNLIRTEIHKAILGIRSATPEQVARSKKWLVEHGFLPYM